MDTQRDDGWQRYDQGGSEVGHPPDPARQTPAAPYAHDPYEAPQPAPYSQPQQDYAHHAPQPTAEARTNVFAVVSLVASVLGILGVLAFIGSVVGIVFAVLARKEIAADPSQQGKGLADWGLILGIVGLVFWFFMAVLMMFVTAIFGQFLWWDTWWY